MHSKEEPQDVEGLKTFQTKALKLQIFHVPFLKSSPSPSPDLTFKLGTDVVVSSRLSKKAEKERGDFSQSHHPPAKVNRQYYWAGAVGDWQQSLEPQKMEMCDETGAFQGRS